MKMIPVLLQGWDFFLLCIDKQNRKHLWIKDSYNYCDMFL